MQGAAPSFALGWGTTSTNLLYTQRNQSDPWRFESKPNEAAKITAGKTLAVLTNKATLLTIALRNLGLLTHRLLLGTKQKKPGP